jgi:CubicO group peptidase (beta-lactamase class C family)
VRNDTLIYAKGYGSANLEYDIPITPKTIFYLASVSKQFAAYSTVLLAKAGKLNLEDDVRIHLPWVPDLKRKITIRHLLNHTSGIRDDLSMATLGGLGDGTILSQQLAIQYIKNSRTLNYEPGEKFLYSQF